MKKRLLIAIGMAAVLAVTGTIVNNTSHKSITQKQNAPENNQSARPITVTQFIVSDPQHPLEQTVEIEPKRTALDLLNRTNKIETNGTGKNAFITKINSREADKNKREFWAFYVNGKQAQVGAGSYILHQSDKIEWKIETY